MLKVLVELSNMIRSGVFPWEQAYLARWRSGKPTDPHQTCLAFVQYALDKNVATVEGKFTSKTIDGERTSWQERMLPTTNFFLSAETQTLAKRLTVPSGIRKGKGKRPISLKNATTDELQWALFCRFMAYSGNPARYSKDGAISCYQCLIAANFVMLLHGITPPASHLPGESLADWLDSDPFKHSRILFKRAGWLQSRFMSGHIA